MLKFLFNKSAKLEVLTLMVTKTYKSEPGVEFQHGRRLFSKSESTNISS